MDCTGFKFEFVTLYNSTDLMGTTLASKKAPYYRSTIDVCRTLSQGDACVKDHAASKLAKLSQLASTRPYPAVKLRD